MIDDGSKLIPTTHGEISVVRFSPDGKVLISGGQDGRIQFWNPDDWRPIASMLVTDSDVNCAEFCGDGTLLAVGHENGQVAVISVPGKGVLFKQSVITGRVFDIEWLGDSHEFVVGGEGGIIYRINAQTLDVVASGRLEPSKEARKTDPVHPVEISHFQYLRDQRSLLTSRSPIETSIIDPHGLRPAQLFESRLTPKHLGITSTASIGGRENYLAAGAHDRIFIFSETDFSVVATIPIPSGVEDLAYSPVANVLVACHRDGSVRSWRLDALQSKVVSATVHTGFTVRGHSIAVSRDGNKMVAGGKLGSMRVWNQPFGRPMTDRQWSCRPVAMGFSPCGRWLAVVGLQQFGPCKTYLHLIEVETGRCLWKSEQFRAKHFIPEQNDSSWWFSFHPKKQEIAVVDRDGHIVICNPMTGAVLGRLALAEGVLGRRFWFAPNGRDLVFRSPESSGVIETESGESLLRLGRQSEILFTRNTLKGEIWCETDGQHLALYENYRYRHAPSMRRSVARRVSRVDVTSDGNWLAAGGLYNEIHLWHLSSGKPSWKLLGQDGICDLRITQDKNTIVTLGIDGIVRLWHLPTKSELLTLANPGEPIQCVAVHPDNRMLVLGIERQDGYFMRVHRLGEQSQAMAASFKLPD